MKHSALPFFAGQHRQERFGARAVFSPLPVMTNVPPMRRTDWLTKKYPHYIELGGGWRFTLSNSVDVFGLGGGANYFCYGFLGSPWNWFER
ncbi:hypothetical protein [Aeromonas dhakensis]|uniref:hypothetical protein n=1 Tax=Aeromonas dhakensis TaxID=196024 RepID=UPI001F156203|nr:hypothetical protein [Aeromonas dhakensis]